jgi:hypothetical protein
MVMVMADRRSPFHGHFFAAFGRRWPAVPHPVERRSERAVSRAFARSLPGAYRASLRRLTALLP